MKYEIEINGVPSGWEPYDVKLTWASVWPKPKNGCSITSPATVSLRRLTPPSKTQVVLEPTGEIRNAHFGEWYFKNGEVHRWHILTNTVDSYPIWREVK